VPFSAEKGGHLLVASTPNCCARFYRRAVVPLFLAGTFTMPIRYKPQLNHIVFDWFYQSNIFLKDLSAREITVLKKSGFFKEYGPPGDPNYTGHAEGFALLKTLSGIMASTIAIRMDAGFKSPLQLIATLQAIEKDPSLALTHWIEPEARDLLWSCYQRAEEPHGKFWFDAERMENTPGLEQIRSAASAAIAKLKLEVSVGRRPDKAIEYLARKSREVFLRYNDAITRHSVRSRRDGEDIQIEGGPFVEFIEELLAAINRFFETVPGAKPISAGAIAEHIRHRGAGSPQNSGSVPQSPHIYHRELC
jgi:hypothetical protein